MGDINGGVFFLNEGLVDFFFGVDPRRGGGRRSTHAFVVMVASIYETIEVT